MASLKRYRQTTDSNAAARFRDLPPRFKRQKSIPSLENTIADNQKPVQNNKSKKSLQKESVISIGNNDASQLNSHVIQPIEISSKDKKTLKKASGNRPHLTVDQNYSRKSFTQPIVLSPMDNNLFDLTRNDEQDQYAPSNSNPFSWQSQPQSTWPDFATFEQANSQETADSHHRTNAGNGQSTTLPTVNPTDYSETDKRIMEMFKELERVAEQKEKEEDESGSDRKTHVSHHLRMLMCAIDKYTEGIDDENVESEGRVDEAPIQERSPSASATQNAAVASTPRKNEADSQRSAPYSGSHITTKFEIQSFPSFPMQSYQTAHPLSLQQVPYFVDSVYSPLNMGKSFEAPKFKPILASSEIRPWDLWSSPSINVLDVYNNLSNSHNSSETADSAFALFDQLGMENYSPRAEECLTRTPLYQR